MKCKGRKRNCPKPAKKYYYGNASECITNGMENITDENGECLTA